MFAIWYLGLLIYEFLQLTLRRLHVLFLKLSTCLVEPTIFGFVLTLVVRTVTACERNPLLCLTSDNLGFQQLYSGQWVGKHNQFSTPIKLYWSLQWFADWTSAVAIFTKVTYLPIGYILQSGSLYSIKSVRVGIPPLAILLVEQSNV